MYDFAIIGAGAAGLQLALAFLDEPVFREKTILIVEPDSKTANDRTFCFWEKGAGRFDSILEKTWARGRFFEQNGAEITLEMGDYQYKMLRSSAFYATAKRQIEAAANVIWQKETCLETIEKTESVEIVCGEKTFAARHVFDSRMPAAFFENTEKWTRLVQHFKGWTIRTAPKTFDSDDLILMDYRQVFGDSMAFFYVMPLADDRALVEFTLFNDQLLGQYEYDAQLRKYITERIGSADFEIEETEYGEIPMTDFPFEKGHSERITKIGTAGGWVRPSSGYSFKNCERFAKRLVLNLKKGEKAEKGIAVGRGRFYDALILDIFKRQNALGPVIFGQLFRRNRADRIFSFLDDTTSIFEEIRVTSSLNWSPFLAALVRWFLK